MVIRHGKGELKIHKSASIVGLRLSEQGDENDPDYVSEDLHPNLGGFRIVKLKSASNPEEVDRKLDEVRQRDEVEVGTHVYLAEGSDRPLLPTGEIIIYFEEAVDREEQNIALDEYRLELVERRSDTVLVAKVTKESANPIKVANLLQQSSLVKTAQPDLDTVLDAYDLRLPQDDLVDHQWHLENKGYIPGVNLRLQPGADAKVKDAWRRLGNFGSEQLTIAVIDNGFDLSHPDLKNKVYRPFDIWNQSTQVYQGDPRYTHGTPCASVALSITNNVGIVGAAPNARFMPISGTSFSSLRTEQMFNYCIENDADIVSCSWGSTDRANTLDHIKESAIARAAREGRNGKGCVIIFAVGNDGKEYINYYAAHPDVIAVGACTSLDQYAPYSNRGMEVDVVAPSNGHWPIIAARAWWDEGYSDATGDYRYWVDGVPRGSHYKHFGGTSSAAPLVAGVCALMLTANPNLTAKEVKAILRQTADKIGHPSEYYNGHSRKYGYGRVNGDRAVAEALRRRDLHDGAATQPGVGSDPASPSEGDTVIRINVSDHPKTGWGVQVGAFQNQTNVLRLGKDLERRFGEPVFVAETNSSGMTLYIVIVGAFPTLDEARELQRTLEANGVNGFPKNFRDV